MSPSNCGVRVQWITTIIFLAALTACRASPSPEPTSTVKSTPVPTETAVSTISPTPVLTATPTPTPEPTPYPPLIWADDLSPVVLGIYNTEWSPISNELLLDTCPDLTISRSEILRAAPPNFVPTTLNNQDVVCVDRPGAAWSPEGMHIVFSGTGPEGSFVDYSSIWIMDKYGNNPYPIKPDQNTGLWIEFIEWMDSETLIYQSYGGGGHRVINVLDVFSETLKLRVCMHGVFHHSAGTYISGTYWAPSSLPVIISMTPDYENASGFFPSHSEYIRLPSAPSGYEDRFFNDGHLQGWRGDQTQLLFRRIFHSIEDDTYNRFTWLVLWDVESDNSVVLAEGAVNAQFSPDGNLLVYLTLGPPWLDEGNKPLTSHYEPIPLGEPQVLNLLDMSTGQVIHSVPVADYQVAFGLGEKPDDIDYQLNITFSPDNRYLTYFSPDDDSQTVLNILDLITLDLVYSAPADTFLPVWSPTGARLIYRNHQMNLTLLDMDTFSVTPLTLSGAQRIHFIDWSFDGQYISMLLGEDMATRDAIILKMPE